MHQAQVGILLPTLASMACSEIAKTGSVSMNGKLACFTVSVSVNGRRWTPSIVCVQGDQCIRLSNRDHRLASLLAAAAEVPIQSKHRATLAKMRGFWTITDIRNGKHALEMTSQVPEDVQKEHLFGPALAQPSLQLAACNLGVVTCSEGSRNLD